MSEVAAGSSFIPPYHQFCSGRRKWKDQVVKPNRQWRHVVTQPKWQPLIKNQMVKPSTYTSRIFTDLPLYESPGALFDEYLEDKPRVFKAIFPDKRRSQRINEEEWKIQMLPIQFLFLTVWPVIDMRDSDAKPGGKITRLAFLTMSQKFLSSTLLDGSSKGLISRETGNAKPA